MSDKDDPIEEMVQKRALSPKQQRMLWARVSALKQLLVRAGLIKHEEYEEVVQAMMNDIDNKNRERIRKDLGAEEEGDDGTEAAGGGHGDGRSDR